MRDISEAAGVSEKMVTPFVPLILAGGSGTRFWPRSRRAQAKQVLTLAGTDSMIQQTLQRLAPLATPEQVFVVTNELLAQTIQGQLPEIPQGRILVEPAPRNTAPACALAAMIVERETPDAVLGVFPSDHVIGDLRRFHEVMRAGIELAAAGDNIVVFGAPPTRPETGYGYIQRSGYDASMVESGECFPYPVKRFTEKPDALTAAEFLQDKAYVWNSGIFLWRARTICQAIREHCPELADPLQCIADHYGRPEFQQVYEAIFPSCRNISIDYAVLEPVSRRAGDYKILCLPADFRWNDLGSWTALHEHNLEGEHHQHSGNVVEANHSILLDSNGNYVSAPGRSVALLGVNDLIVVQTDDALLVTTKAQAQNVGRIVQELTFQSRFDLI